MKKDKTKDSPIDSEKLTQKCEAVAEILKALSNPDRLKMMCALWDGEKTVSELEAYAGVSQSMMSQFLNRLRLEGIVASRKEGVFVYYHISDARVRQLVQSLYAIFCEGK
jgi:ArsR family transcriptional regulator, virulence genes transcriptional regulator